MVVATTYWFFAYHQNTDTIRTNDWRGRHVCQINSQARLQIPLPASVKYPSKDSLWDEVYKAVQAHDNECNDQHLPDSFHYAPIYSALKNHYIAEVRRSVLDFEAGKRMEMPSVFSVGFTERIDPYTRVPYTFRGDSISIDADFMHDKARCDVLNWFAKNGRFASNAVPVGQIKSADPIHPLIYP
ncbi:MAG: hypothetical protein HY014_13715 [Acidobacteria bacterium]|nr:hypothetical protein [Acidobacteriota bacterium]MBI3489214.1 hypothetical protein [Acidobacteriota bacterium]